ncbi:MAG: GYD domain-containing protein [Rhizobiaceae bacterium]
MPLFITYASYSQSGVKGMVDNPADRAEAVQPLLEKAGCKLIAMYMTTGKHDVVIIPEAPDGADTVAIGMAITSTGAMSEIETVRAWTSKEFQSMAERAAHLVSSYEPPNH